jgi:hypothetical protein
VKVIVEDRINQTRRYEIERIFTVYGLASDSKDDITLLGRTMSYFLTRKLIGFLRRRKKKECKSLRDKTEEVGRRTGRYFCPCWLGRGWGL